MKTRRYSEARVFQILQEVDAGCIVAQPALGNELLREINSKKW